MSVGSPISQIMADLKRLGWIEIANQSLSFSRNGSSVLINLDWRVFLSRIGVDGEMQFQNLEKLGCVVPIIVHNFIGISEYRALSTDCESLLLARRFTDIAEFFLCNESIFELKSCKNDVPKLRICLIKKINSYLKGQSRF